MSVLLANNAKSILSASISNADTQIRVRTGHGARFPQPAKAGDWFPLTLEDASGNIEIVQATARTGDTITVTRGAEGTMARTFIAGDAVELRMTAGVFASKEDVEAVTVSISDGVLG